MSVLRPSAHSTTTSPPRPPSPPSGPPNSMNFSRRNETAPAPPSPERMYTRAWSRNFIAGCLSRGARQGGFRLASQRDGGCPIRAGKAQAMAFDQTPARRRALQAGAEKREPTLLEQGLRGLILDPDAGQDLERRRQPESRVDYCSRGLGREALAPDLGRQHVAERQAVAAARFEADRPNGVGLAFDRRHHQGQVASSRVRFARGIDEPLSRAFWIGMKDARGVAGHFPAAAKFMDRRGVADSRPAQPKPRRLKPEHIVSCQIGKHEITGQRPPQGP